MSDNGADRRIDVQLLSNVMKDDYRLSVVDRALKWRPKASGHAKQAFKTTIDNSNLEVKGFRSKQASRAPANILRAPIAREMQHSNQLTSAVLMVWVESQQDLREIVAEHLRNAQLPARELDYSSGQFNGTWDADSWQREVDGILEHNGDLSKDDVCLMLCCVSGNMLVPRGSEFDVSNASMSDSVYPHWIEFLSALPPDAPEWEHVEEFIDLVSDLAEDKNKEFNIALELDERIKNIKESFAVDLEYLEANTDAWTVFAFYKPTHVDETSQLLTQLQESLDQYAAVRERAPTRTEEETRAVQRQKLESQVLEHVDQLDQLMALGLEYAEEQQRLEDAAIAAAQGNGLSAGQNGESTGIASAAGALPAAGANSAADASVDAEAEAAAVRAELASLKEEHEKASQDAEALRAEINEQKRSNDAVTATLAESQRMEDYWRGMYVDARKTAADGPQAEETAAEIADVKTAIERAAHVFANELQFNLNSKSEKNPRFRDAQAVWSAFAWLATEYHRHKRGESGSVDLDLSIRRTCGWFYRPKQSDTTVGEFPEYYTATVNGKKHRLNEHIGKGATNNASTTIRIGFYWDKNNQVVVIGYIGQHQRTRAT